MSTTIDHQVVEMRFDNKHFEQNVSTTMSTLDKFKQKLNMTDAAKGLENVNVAAKNVDLSSIGRSADTVGLRFNALYTIADQAFRNITNSAYNAGKNIVKSLTIDPVTTGFNEYELKMGSIQTIMAGTGESLDTVNKYLAELNEYSDKTIYSFKDMTSNIGKFTNAGVSLEDAVLAIKGISNEAALSGANANEASRAMYNFSQALSAGFVKLIDWKSIENANMATKDFKQQLIDTAVEIGTLKEGADGMYDVANVVSKANAVTLNATKNFNDSLGNQWMTTDVLIKTLAKYADETTEVGQKATVAATEVKTFTMMMDTLKEAAQSGWAQTWELFVGDFEQAKAFFTELSDIFGGIIGDSSNKRNAFLGEALTSNWDKLIEKINKAGIETSKFEEAIRKCYNNDEALDKLIEEHGSLEEAIRSGAIATEILQKAFDKIADGGATEEIASFVEGLKEIKRILKYDSVGEDVKKLQTALDALGYDLGAPGIDGIIGPITEAAIKAFQTDHGLEVDGIVGPETLAALEAAGKKTNKLEGDVDDLKKSCKELIDVITKKGGRELLLESLLNIITAIRKPLGAVSKAFGKIFDVKPAHLYSLIENFNKLTKALIISDETAEKLQKTFEGVFSVFKIVSTIAGGAFGIAFKLLMVVLEKFNIGFLDLTANIGEGLKTISDFINDGIKKGLGATIEWLLPKITKLIEAIKKWIGQLKETKIGKEVIDIFENWPKTLDRIGDALDTCVKAIKDWIEELRNTQLYKDVSGWFGSIGNAVADSIEKIKGSISNFSIAGFSERFESLRSFFTGLYESLKQNRFVIAAVDGIKTAFGKVKDFFGKFKLPEFNLDNMKKWFDKLAWFEVSEDATGGGIKGFFTAIGDYFNGNVVKLKIRDFKESALQKFANFYLTMGDKVKAAFEKCREIMAAVAEFIFGSKDVKLPDIIDLGKKILEILVLIEALKALQKVVAPLDNITSALDNVATSLKWSAMSSMFKSMAIALGVFTICLIVISQIPAEDAKRSAILLGSLIVVLGGVVALIGWLAGKVDGGVNTAGAVASLLMLVGSIVILVYALKELDKLHLNNPLETFLKLFVVIMAMTAGVKMIGKAGSTSFRSVAAILTLMAALKMMLDVVEAYDKFEWGGKGDAVFRAIGMIVALSVAINLASRGIKAGSSAAGLALAIVAMVIALKVIITTIDDIAKIPPENIKKAAPVIAGILGFMTLLMGVANLTNKGIKLEKGQRAVNNFAGFAVALLAVVAAIWLLGKMALNNEQVLIKGGNAVGAIMLAFTAMFTAIGLACSGLKMGSIWSMIAGIVIVVAALSTAIYLLRDIPWQTSVGVAGAMALVIVAMGMALKTLVKYDVYSGNIWHWVGAMAVLALIVAGLALVLKECKDVSWQTALGVAGGLSLLIVAMAVALETLTKHNFKAKTIYKWIGALAVLAVVLFALVGVLHLMKTIDPINAIGHVTALSLLLNAMSSAMLIISQSKGMSWQQMGAVLISMGVLSAVLYAIVGVLHLMKTIDPVGSMGHAIALGVLLNTMASSLLILSYAKHIYLDGILGMAGLAAIMILLVPTLHALNGIVVPINTAIALGVLLNLMATALWILQYVYTVSVGAMLGMAAMALIIALLGQVLVAISKANCESMMTTVVSLSILLLTLTGVFVILGLAGSLAPTAISGALGLVSVLGILGVAALLIADFMSLFSEDRIETWKSRLEDFMDLLVILAEGLGEIVGGFFGGVLAGFTDGLKQVGEDLRDFAAAISEIDPDAATGMSSLCGALVDLTTASFIEGLTSLFGGKDLSSFGKSVADFAVCIKDAAAALSGITDDDVANIERAATAGTAMSKLANAIPSSGGKWQEWFGEKNLKQFGETLVDFGTCIVNYSKTISDEAFNVDAIKASAEAGTAMSDVANAIPASGGLWQEWIVGERNLGQFGKTLIDFGNALIEYNALVTDESFNPEAIKASAEAGKALADVANAIPSSGGAWTEWIVGEKNLADFGNQLITFGKGILSYSNVATQITEDKITAITNSGKAMDEIKKVMEKVPEKANWWDNLWGNNKDGGSFGDAITSVANGIKRFCTVAVSIKDQIGSISNVGTAITNVKTVLNDIPDEETIAKATSFESAVSTLTSAASALNSFSAAEYDYSGLVPFRTAVTRIKNMFNGTDVASIAEKYGSAYAISTHVVKIAKEITKVNNYTYEGVDSLKKAISDLGTADVDSMIEAFKGKSGDVKSAVGGFITAMGSAIEQKANVVSTRMERLLNSTVKTVNYKKDDFNTAGKELGEKLADGLDDKKTSVKTAGSALAEEAASGAKTGYSGMYKAGKYLVDGFVKGIDDNDYRAAAKAAAMAEVAVAAAKAALKINSPSKVFRAIGYSIPEGFSMGIDRMGWMVKDSVVTMGNLASRSLSSTISRIADAVNTDIDAQPTIRPVLDLSDVRAGAGMIGSMLGGDASVGVLANVGSISNMMNNRSQNGSNADIVHAIKDLKKDLANVGNTTNIIDSVTYDDGSNIHNTVTELIRAVKMGGRA